MRSKDITLSASLITLYVIAVIYSSLTGIKITGLMLAALFGMFWNYLSPKTNLTIQAVRFIYNLSKAVFSLPALIGFLKMESIVGLSLLEFMNTTGKTTYDSGVALLEATAQANISIGV